MKKYNDLSETETRELYKFIAENWNSMEKEEIAAKFDIPFTTVTRIATTIAKVTGMKMRPQRRQKPSILDSDFISELKRIHKA